MNKQNTELIHRSYAKGLNKPKLVEAYTQAKLDLQDTARTEKRLLNDHESLLKKFEQIRDERNKLLDEITGLRCRIGKLERICIQELHQKHGED